MSVNKEKTEETVEPKKDTLCLDEIPGKILVEEIPKEMPDGYSIDDYVLRKDLWAGTIIETGYRRRSMDEILANDQQQIYIFLDEKDVIATAACGFWEFGVDDGNGDV